MILQALVQRYDDIGGAPFGWKMRPCDFAIRLDEQGNVLKITPLEITEGKKKIRKEFLLPEDPVRSSGIKPFFLCDNAKYFFGVDPKKGEEAKAATAKLYKEILEQIDSSAAKAILLFFNKSVIPEDLSPTGSFVFMVNGRYAHEDPKIREAWDYYYNKPTTQKQEMCLVTGQNDIIEEQQGKITLRGVSAGAVPLISINADSFTSYGKTTKDPAAQIGKKATFKYVTALNDLLKSKNNHKYLAGDTIVYWAKGHGEQEEKVFNLLADPPSDDYEITETTIKNVMEAIARQNNIDIDKCDFKREFYVLCLSPNAGRMSVRFFWRSSFGDIIKNINAHYKNMEIVSDNRNKYRFIPPWQILAATTVKEKTDDAAPLLSGQLMQAIITGRDYPLTLYNAMLNRIRAGADINRVRVSVIKAALIKNKNLNNKNETEVITVALNPNSTNIPYNLGRLFSVLERLQEQANDSSGIRASYFASASANPSTVFPTLLKLSVHHAKKVTIGTCIKFEKLKSEILSNLDDENPFPNTLNMEEQGKFIIGYYHQRQDFFTNKDNLKENEEDV
ncbi:MAG: type I-C CRISPR-associated protein Cas8c/Csd1 [Oscillospiraceae bacterium]|jgi:CRISPR-associated protein Csd1|nr:type I-C CRISPR-associated protein Cas8c/Csd1 [Oscillospiraceae bacterium]